MSIVVTGASGHLGGAVVRALLAQGRKVKAIYNSDRRAIDGLACESVQANVCDPRAMREVLAGADVLYHFAAQISIWGDPTGSVHRINVLGVRNVMAAAREAGVRRVVHCSSIHALESPQPPAMLDETATRVEAAHHPAYSRSKANGEREVLRAVSEGLDAVILNPTGILGPYDFKPSRMGKFFLAIARREMPALVAGGIDWVDVRDVAASAIAASERGVRGESYLLGGRWASLADLARIAERSTGVRAPRFSTPLALARVGAPFAELYARVAKTEPLYTRESLVALSDAARVSQEKASRALGHTSRPLEDTVADLHQWFRENGQLAS